MFNGHEKSRREFLRLGSRVLGAAMFGTPLAASVESHAQTAASTAAPLKVAYPSTSGAMVPLWLAHEAGLFKKHGANVTIQLIASNAITAALLSDQIDLAVQSPTGLLTANINGGSDLVFIGLQQNKSPYSFVLSNTIKDPKDLKGKAVGTDRPGTGADYRTGAFLALFGLKESDVTLLRLGNPNVIAAAMASGQVVAGALVPPFSFQLEERGFRIIAEGSSLSGADFSFGPMVRKSRIDKLAPALQGFTKGFQEAMALYLKDPKQSQAVLQKYSKESNPVVLEKTYNLYAKVFNPSLKMDAAALQELIDYLAGNILPKAKGAKAQDFIDARFVN